MFIALLRTYRDHVLQLKAFDKILRFYYDIKIESIDNLWTLYFHSINIRSNTPRSFSILVKNLKANYNKPGKILALEEMDEIGNFQDYDTLPMYTEELISLQEENIKCSPSNLKLEHNKILNFIGDFPDPFYIGKVYNEDELKPFIKMATYKIDTSITIGENITKTIVFDLRDFKGKNTQFK